MRLTICKAWVLLLATSASSHAWAWGSRGHSNVNQAATQLMGSPGAAFFKANSAQLAFLANVPDAQWKSGSLYAKERSLHFFQWDKYEGSSMSNDFDTTPFPSAVQKLGRPFVELNGLAVWRVTQIYRMMVGALKAKKWPQVIQYAGVMGHYVGDLSQPMHVSSDYDGQSIRRTGVHKYFETTLVDTVSARDLLDETIRNGSDVVRTLSHSDNARLSPEINVQTLTLNEGIESLESLAPVLAEFSPTSQDDQGLRTFLGPRLGAGAATLAHIWDLAVQDSGVATGFPQSCGQVPAPAWFAL